jgi:hypothetical protein
MKVTSAVSNFAFQVATFNYCLAKLNGANEKKDWVKCTGKFSRRSELIFFGTVYDT